MTSRNCVALLAKFLAEVGAEEQKRNLGLILGEIDNYQRGVRPSGPHAHDLIEAFDAFDAFDGDNVRACPPPVIGPPLARSCPTAPPGQRSCAGWRRLRESTSDRAA